MTNTRRRLIGVGIPFGLAFVTDTALTIALRVNHPVWETQDRLFFHLLSLIHPLAVVAGYVSWACVITGLLLLLPDVLAVIVTITAVFGHVGGAYSQLVPALGRWGYQITNGIFLLTAVALGAGLWWLARVSPAVQHSDRAEGLRTWARWGLIALLAAAAGCMVLIPSPL